MAGGGGGGGINWEIGIDMYTLMCIKQISNMKKKKEKEISGSRTMLPLSHSGAITTATSSRNMPLIEQAAPAKGIPHALALDSQVVNEWILGLLMFWLWKNPTPRPFCLAAKAAEVKQKPYHTPQISCEYL